MKVFFVQTSTMIDTIIKKDKMDYDKLDFNGNIHKFFEYGFSSLFGIDKEKLNLDNKRYNSDIDFFCSVPNSKYLQAKWAREHKLKITSNWKKEILSAQIEEYKPDVLYSVNYDLINKDMKNYLPKVQLYTLWNASPLLTDDLSWFDLGISFNQIYINNMKKCGIKQTEFNTFYIDPENKTRLKNLNLSQDIDISFCGRYSKMFKSRNQFLYDVLDNFKDRAKIEYYLLTGRRIKGLIPEIPFRVLRAYNKPVFLKDLFKVFNKSKIVLNTHSNITGDDKGNMRIYEVLSSGSFMLSDDGNYPKYLEPNIDFVTYKDKDDMIQKIDYYLKNDKEREEIAQNGYDKISKHYNTKIGANSLKTIFERYI